MILPINYLMIYYANSLLYCHGEESLQNNIAHVTSFCKKERKKVHAHGEKETERVYFNILTVGYSGWEDCKWYSFLSLYQSLFFPNKCGLPL